MEDICDVRLIVTYNEIRAKEIVEDYQLYDRNVMYYPAKDLIFYSADVHGQALVKERLKVIQALTGDSPLTIVTTIDAGMDACVPYSRYAERAIVIREGDILDLEDIKKQLSGLGYEHVAQVEREGEFSVRGGILDVFPLTEESPCRIDLWDEEVDTIRSIDVESQRSIEPLSQICIFPASEVFVGEERALKAMRQIRLDMEKQTEQLKQAGKKEEAARLRQNVENFQEAFEAYHGMVNLESYILYFEKEIVSFFDYFKNRNTIVFLDDSNRCTEKAEAVEYEFRDSMATRLEKGYILPEQMDILYSLPQVLHKLQQYPLVMMTTLDVAVKDIAIERKFFFQVQSSPSYNNNFAMMAKDIARLQKQQYRILLVSASETRGRRLCDDLREYDIHAFYEAEMERELQPGEVMVTRAGLRRGFEYPAI